MIVFKRISEINMGLVALTILCLVVLFVVVDFIFSPSPPERETTVEEAINEAEEVMREVFGSDYKPLSDEDKKLLIENPEKFAEKIQNEIPHKVEKFRAYSFEQMEDFKSPQKNK